MLFLNEHIWHNIEAVVHIVCTVLTKLFFCKHKCFIWIIFIVTYFSYLVGIYRSLFSKATFWKDKTMKVMDARLNLAMDLFHIKLNGYFFLHKFQPIQTSRASQGVEEYSWNINVTGRRGRKSRLSRQGFWLICF